MKSSLRTGAVEQGALLNKTYRAHASPTRGRFSFKRDRLPNPAEYFREQGLKLTGGGEWKSAVCPFSSRERCRRPILQLIPEAQS